MIEKSYSESNVTPPDLEVKNLGGKLYEITKNDNITSFERTHEDTTETMYKCDKTILRKKITSRNEAIVAFIRLRYTQDDEFALTNKGIQDSQDTEYVKYRQYVEWCKEQANIYWVEQ
jgi:dihydroxyacetone kinase-like predicted kinase